MIYRFDNGLTYDDRNQELSFENAKQKLRGAQRALFEVIIESERSGEPERLTHELAAERMKNKGSLLADDIFSTRAELCRLFNSNANEIRKKIRKLVHAENEEVKFIAYDDGWHVHGMTLLTPDETANAEIAAAPAGEREQDRRYHLADRYLINGNAAMALRMQKELADEGYPKAINSVGIMLAKGQGTDKNIAEGLRYIRIAAEGGLAAAQLNLGLAYRWAFGVKPDYEQAFEWFRKAAENPDEPDEDAMAWLSECYRLGIGTKVNDREAERWAEKARRNGADPMNPVNFWTQP